MAHSHNGGRQYVDSGVWIHDTNTQILAHTHALSALIHPICVMSSVPLLTGARGRCTAQFLVCNLCYRYRRSQHHWRLSIIRLRSAHRIPDFFLRFTYSPPLILQFTKWVYIRVHIQSLSTSGFALSIIYKILLTTDTSVTSENA